MCIKQLIVVIATPLHEPVKNPFDQVVANINVVLKVHLNGIGKKVTCGASVAIVDHARTYPLTLLFKSNDNG